MDEQAGLCRTWSGNLEVRFTRNGALDRLCEQAPILNHFALRIVYCRVFHRMSCYIRPYRHENTLVFGVSEQIRDKHVFAAQYTD